MPSHHLTITDESGHGLNGIIVQSGEYNSSPCPGWPNTGNCTSGPGGPWEGTSDSSGTILTDWPYTCPGQLTGNLYASGYDLYPYTYKSGSITGDTYDTVQMVQSSVSGGAPNNQGGNATAGNLADQYAASTTGVSLDLNTSLSNFFGGSTDGIPNWLVILAVVIVFVVLLALLLRRK